MDIFQEYKKNQIKKKILRTYEKCKYLMIEIFPFQRPIFVLLQLNRKLHPFHHFEAPYHVLFRRSPKEKQILLQ